MFCAEIRSLRRFGNADRRLYYIHGDGGRVW